MKAYQRLEQEFKEIEILSHIGGILNWDASVIMPANASESRGEQLSILTKINHEKILNDKIYQDITQAENESAKLNKWQKANLRQMKRIVNHARATPIDLAIAKTKVANDCEMQWREARSKSKFNVVKQKFKELVSLEREIAQVRSEYFKLSPYDSLLDLYDQGRKSKQVDKIFDQLISFLPSFIDNVIEKQVSPPKIDDKYPSQQQKELGEYYMKVLGINFNKTRLDISTHPFCGGTPHDIRITTRYDESNFLSGLSGILHETGHALYEANLPCSMAYQPVSNSCGMTIHESQSLFVEMQICRSVEFLTHLSKKLPKYFKVKSNKINPKILYSNITKVKRSFIRVDADEVTYPLHVILRYQIEKKLISKEMEVEDLPIAWNEMMQKFLKIKPKNDTQGCLQDIHWYSGVFGYFPCYTLGAITAAQLMHKFMSDNKDYSSLILRGDLKVIIEWLKEKIHKLGSYYLPDELVESATEEKLNADYFIKHLKARYQL